MDSRAIAPRRRPAPAVASALLLGIAIAAALFIFGREHTPDYSGTGLFGRTAADTLSLKSWLATGVLALAAVQVLLALWMYGKLRLRIPARLGTGHRLVGLTLLLLSLPIGYHCMFAYGVQTMSGRVAVHSLAGCFFYGAVAAKVVIVRSRVRGLVLPLAGGAVAVLVALLWYTSALWYFNDFRLPL